MIEADFDAADAIEATEALLARLEKLCGGEISLVAFRAAMHTLEVVAAHPMADPDRIADAINEKELPLRFLCVDCGKDTHGGEYYMVWDEVWEASGMTPDGGMLCLPCLERRIGRHLTPDDFTAIFPSKEAWRALVARR